MNQTCCPQYTIRCDSLNFKLRKSHKKVLKKVNRYLIHGIKPTSDKDEEFEELDNETEEKADSNKKAKPETGESTEKASDSAVPTIPAESSDTQSDNTSKTIPRKGVVSVYCLLYKNDFFVRFSFSAKSY